jgi:hypothetical protein
VAGGSRPVALRIDAEGGVELVDDRWNAFVAGRRVAALTPIDDGAPFRSAIEGGDAAALYDRILERARRGHSVDVDVIAMSATERMRLVLRVAPDGHGAIDLGLRTIHRRRTLPVPLFDPDSERSDESVKSCAFCQRIFGFSWEEAHSSLRQLRIEADEPQPLLRSAVCDDCERSIYASCRITPLGY